MRFFIITLFFLSIAFNREAISLSLQEKLLFWDKPKKGANMFNKIIDRKDIQDAKNMNIKFIRLNIERLQTQKRDFLLGNADDYKELVPEDLNVLKQILDMFAEEGMPVILSINTLPGCRYYENNNGVDDLRIWYLEKYQTQAAAFWSDVSREVKGHPAIVGFNILNRPMPEKLLSQKNEKYNEVKQAEIQEILYNFYQNIISAIRENDKNVKIIIDSSAEGNPSTFKELIKQNASNIMYSFHMYEPITYTDKRLNKNKSSYPGVINEEDWDKDNLRNHMQTVKNFQINNKILNSQIIVSGFGCNRYAHGIENYLQDMTDLFSEFGWHTTFSYFRGDIDDDMDYEIGDKKLPWSYYQARDSGFNSRPIRDSENKIFKIIKDYLDK